MKFTLKSIFNLKSILVGTLLSGTLILTPIATHAQEPLTQLPVMAAIEQLNLTADQESQLVRIRQNTRAQLESILSESQRQSFKTTLEQGGSFRSAVAAMNLTEEQRTQLRTVFQSVRTEASTILTTEQRQQIRDWVLARLSDRP
ncbi:MAG: Spy/CpxP family protein refolding chaperone [Oculatellaceae cyanobacterium Prado106]|jgi:Spy/CpxP family protein refolding chaperone|nr:Spy/CpxP family protein refolding chaperone [Oculatellaceae cyanobacterium Prado106]